MPLPPRPTEPPPAKSSWLALLLAGTMGLMIVAGLVMLTGGFLALVIVIGGGVFALAALHYLVWGWWLPRVMIDRDDESETDALDSHDQFDR